MFQWLDNWLLVKKVWGSNTQSPMYNEIYFFGLYVWRSWLIGIKSDLGPVDLGSIPTRAFVFNHVMTLSRL